MERHNSPPKCTIRSGATLRTWRYISLVFKPNEIYRQVRNVAPDLIVHFGGLLWRSIGTVGYPGLYIQENDTGPDACNHAQFGMFAMATPNCVPRGSYQGARLLDIAPTLLDLAGYQISLSK